MTITVAEVVVAEPRHWTGSPLRAAGCTLSTWAARVLSDASFDADGLYLATTDEGTRGSVAFWGISRETGLALAAPGTLPWSHVAGPAGELATTLGITGPTQTLAGGCTWPDALDRAYLDVEAEIVRRALVVGLTSTAPMPGGWSEPVRWFLSATVVSAG